MTCNGRTAVIDALCNGDIRIVEVIHQPQTGHFPFNWLDAGSAANQIDDLIAVEFPAHKGFKRDDFAASLIRPPRSAAYDTAQC